MWADCAASCSDLTESRNLCWCLPDSVWMSHSHGEAWGATWLPCPTWHLSVPSCFCPPQMGGKSVLLTTPYPATTKPSRTQKEKPVKTHPAYYHWAVGLAAGFILWVMNIWVFLPPGEEDKEGEKYAVQSPLSWHKIHHLSFMSSPTSCICFTELPTKAALFYHLQIL